MSALSWNNSMSVKISSIDNQHQKLIQLVNEFYENISIGSNNELVSKLLKGMKEYALVHFSKEEQYLIEYKYPFYEEHKKEHNYFIGKVNDLENRFNRGKIILSFEITSFLKDWIKKHISEEDKKYSDFLVKSGIR